MKLARYVGGGEIAIVDEPKPTCPPGGLLVRTEASGLCSGELMDWYMEQKVPHVLGHEVAGVIVESDCGWPIGSRVFAHHHAPCMRCDYCDRHLFVHCPQWKRTKLTPGGMAEYFAVSPENLKDTFIVDDLRAVDAALIEPLGCVMKSLGLTDYYVASTDTDSATPRVAVIGLGVMGLMHVLLLRWMQSRRPANRVALDEDGPDGEIVGYEVSAARATYARKLGITVRRPEEAQEADIVFVCPGNKSAIELALKIAAPGATVVLFAPLPPGEKMDIDLNALYFREVRLLSAYSCGPYDTNRAAGMLRAGALNAEQVVSNFISIEELPEYYGRMKKGEILKPMVVF